MKLFLSKILVFCCAWILFISLISFVNAKLFYSVYEKNYTGYKTLILGDSHTRLLNEKEISNSLNLSRAAENYKVAYHKLKYFSNLNDLDKVILSYSYHNFGIHADVQIKGNYHSIYRSYSIQPPTSIFDRNAFSNSIKVLFKYVLSFNNLYFAKYLGFIDPYYKNPVDQHLTYLTLEEHEKQDPVSKFSKMSEKEQLNLVYSRLNLLFRPVQHGNFWSELSVSYIEEIVELCNKEGIKLYLCNMPLNPLFRKNISAFHKEQFQQLTERLKKEHSVQYIDLENYLDDRQDLMSNQDHCTRHGAAYISSILERQFLK